MQVKTNESHNRAAQADTAQVHEAAHAKEASKTADAHKQADAQHDASKQWDKFAANKGPAAPASVAEQTNSKQVEATQQSISLDIQAQLRKNSIPV